MKPDLVWDLLPGELRARDEAAGGMLHALVTVLAEHAAAVDADIDALWDDWFIETCAEWVVPYVGDLVGVRGMHPLTGAAAFSNRARVADTIRFRRRKGTAAMLEELARTSTGWTAAAVEFFERLVTTQHVNHVRLGAPGTANLRDASALELVGGPFETVCHTVDVRPMSAHVPAHGWYNLPNVGLFVWPLPAYPLDRATAAPIVEQDGRWHADPLGFTHHFVGPTVAEPDIDHRADESNVPGPLRRRPLHDELDALREVPPLPDDQRRWFRDDSPSFVVWIQPTANDPLSTVELADLHVCDLGALGQPTGTQVRVDPVLGLVSVAKDRPVHRLAVSWSYAFGGDIGAGPYPRRGELGSLAEPVDWQIGVSVTDPPVANEVVPTIGDAVDAWHTWQAAHPGTTGRIVVMDSHRYVESFTSGSRIEVGQGSRLGVLAAHWPQPEDRPRRADDPLDPVGVRPCLIGDVEVIGTGAGERPGQFAIDGVLLGGRLTVVAPAPGDAGLGRLEVRHTTVIPYETVYQAGSGIALAAGNDRTEVVLDRVITGPLAVADQPAGPVTVTDSIIQAEPDGTAIAASGADATLRGVTAMGRTTVRGLAADDCLFVGTVTVDRKQLGCVRFSHVPVDSQTPRRYRCQPDLAMAAAPTDPDVATRVAPVFASTRYGTAAYGRLAETSARELREGAESGAEMGAFRHTLTPQRLTNLRTALDEYLPLGRTAAALPVLPTGGDLT